MSVASSVETQPQPFTFDLSRCVAFDVEVYPGRWCVGFYGTTRNGSMQTRLVEDRGKLANLLAYFAEHGKILVGYNSQRFDVPLIRAILGGFDPYAPAQALIRGERFPFPSSKLPAFKPDYIDISARLRRGGGFPSLKTVAANLGRPTLRELPYAPDTILTDEQWKEVKAYNQIDLAHTWALLERVAPDLQALAALSQDLNQDLRSTPSPGVVERVFLAAYHRQHSGIDPAKPELPHEVIYRPVEGVVRPRTPEAVAWFDSVTKRPIPVITIGENPRVQVPRATFTIGRLKISVGAGGLHSIDEARVYYSTKRHRLVSLDVASFYPSLIASKGIAPAAYGSTGSATYSGILQRRLDIKKQVKTAADPAERERLDVQATGLKLILNSTFGKFGDAHSTLFDPAALIAVTISGQLMLIDLIERLTAAGVRVVSANTDGLFILTKRKDKRWKRIISEWQRDTAMTLEVEPLKRLAIVATNNFATLDIKGKIKRRGDAFKGSLSPLASPNNLIVNDAVTAALLQDVPPERMVRGCSDPVRFCRVTRRTGKVVEAVLHDETTGEENALPKITRWYKAKDSHRRIIHQFEDGRHVTPRDAIGVELALDLTAGDLPKDLDRSWYIGQARKTIQKVRGYRHLARCRLESHPLATEVLHAGLVPVPKWGGKAQLPGSDPARPTYLWDWSHITTVGTFTGPAVGILVIDLDDPTRFRLWADKGNSPLLMDRWDDLRGCLVSVHGETTADEVRTGRGRGKLIFRLAADPDHPLSRLAIGKWKDSRGIEVFYGKGLPSVLGEHPSGERYRLEGTIGDAPDWLIEGLIPKASKRAKASTRPPSSNGHVVADDPWTTLVTKSGRDAVEAPPPEFDHAALDTLRQDLVSLDPVFGEIRIGWRSKPLADDRVILIGRCPGEHDSGTSTDGDLSAGFNQDGEPYIRCMHQSCTIIPEIDRRLKALLGYRKVPAIDVPTIELTDIARSMVTDLMVRNQTSVHMAPTGSGKSHGKRLAAAQWYRMGGRCIIAVHTLTAAKEYEQGLRAMVPDAFAGEAVSIVCGHHRDVIDLGATDDVHGEQGDGDDPGGEYPIHEWTKIVICSHAQLMRRGFSRYMRAIWTKLDPDDDQPAFRVMVDEIQKFIDDSRWEIPLAHRYKTQALPDRSGSVRVPVIRGCPQRNHSGNCENCILVKRGGEVVFNSFSIRELVPPRKVHLDRDGNLLNRPLATIEVSGGDVVHSEKVRVGHTVWAAALIRYRDVTINPDDRLTAFLWLFRKDEKGRHPPETIEEILAHLFRFARHPVLLWEHPVDANGEIVRSDTLAARRARDPKKWSHDIQFPRAMCEVPTIRLTDMLAFEQLRRFQEKTGASIVLTGAYLGPDNLNVLRSVWPHLVLREYPYGDRKIDQCAIVYLDGRTEADLRGLSAFLTDDKCHLRTSSLESIGLGLYFAPTKDIAESIYNLIKHQHPSAHFVDGNDEVKSGSRNSAQHLGADVKVWITYSRGIMGVGANILHLRYLVLDANAFRDVAGFNPADITPEAFAEARAQERLALILQNLGRALRGEDGKTVVLFILNADAGLVAAIENSPAFRDGCKRSPVFTHQTDVVAAIDQAKRWLESGGGEWPEPTPGAKDTRRKGRKNKTKDAIYQAAEVAIKTGVSWRDFSTKRRPDRTLTTEEVESLKTQFKIARGR
jgi:hypothetical protein